MYYVIDTKIYPKIDTTILTQKQMCQRSHRHYYFDTKMSCQRNGPMLQLPKFEKKQLQKIEQEFKFKFQRKRIYKAQHGKCGGNYFRCVNKHVFKFCQWDKCHQDNTQVFTLFVYGYSYNNVQRVEFLTKVLNVLSHTDAHEPKGHIKYARHL